MAAPSGRGFSRHEGLSSDEGVAAWGGERGAMLPRSLLHRLDEPTELFLGTVASPQSRLPFHPAVQFIAAPVQRPAVLHSCQSETGSACHGAFCRRTPRLTLIH